MIMGNAGAFKFCLAFLLVSVSAHFALDERLLRALGSQGVNLWRLRSIPTHGQAEPTISGLVVQDYSALRLPSDSNHGFIPQWFNQPLDHFRNVSETFGQRFWVNTRHYRPNSGSPVYVLDGGETSGEDRLSFLDTGIMEILARATGGVSIVLEHRYYGKSIPVSDLSTDSLRWLDNTQSAADSANFMRNVKFNGIDEDLTAPSTPWIYYGGSYAGARAAHMKILYPDLVYGAIASSAVTHATLELWQYMEIIRRAAEPQCASNLEKAVQTIDEILKQRLFAKPLKALFGLADLEHDEDFVSLLTVPIFSWQSKNWDPAVGSAAFENFCSALNKPPYRLTNSNADVPYGDAQRIVDLPGNLALDFVVWNYAKYIRDHVVSRCPQGVNIEQCFETYDDAKFQNTSLDQEWRLWIFQVCTEWGYFITAPPDMRHPRIISQLLTLDYQSRICHQAFPPGKHFNIPAMPNITAVNALGDFDIAADRLAIIDGEVDPWRPATPHSEDANDRDDTVMRPFKIIPGGVHHYDENGLQNISLEPSEIRKIHIDTISFVKKWLEDWRDAKQTAGIE